MDEFTKVKEVLRINCFCPIGLAPAAGTKDACQGNRRYYVLYCINFSYMESGIITFCSKL